MSQRFDQLVDVMTRLRGEGGCPWDRQQTPESLRPFLIEEAYEVLEALESGHAEPLREELGDLLFQVLFHAQIAKEEGDFDIEDVLSANIEKMTRRHPHIFSDEALDLPDAETVLAHWEAIKRREARHHTRTSALDGVPRELPALLQAHKVQNKAARVGFDWKTIAPVFEKIREELGELEEAVASTSQTKAAEVEAELGDLLFSVVNAARHLKVNPEDALRRATARFIGRFQQIESRMSEAGRALQSLPQEEMDRLWEEAKRAS
jgi:tetrapyrrole methylase family protein/MazG family protein